METELAKQAYEQIDNYILRLLLIYLGVSASILVSAIAYLFRALVKRSDEALEREKEMTAALNNAADGYENLRDEIRSLSSTLKKRNS